MRFGKFKITISMALPFFDFGSTRVFRFATLFALLCGFVLLFDTKIIFGQLSATCTLTVPRIFELRSTFAL